MDFARAVLVGAALLALAAAVHAQERPGHPAPAASPAGLAAPTLRPPSPASDSPPGLGPEILASAILPGATQYLAGDDRWVPYVAAEIWAWVSYVQQRRAGARLRSRYRDVAWQVARRISVGERRDTTWGYYESMSYWGASGAWDREPGTPGVQPEFQPGTYNGQMWALARGLYFQGGAPPEGSPEYQQALAYYLRRAVPPEYSWAWGVSQLEQQEFVSLIQESDQAFRSARNYLGLVLANHLVSTVDGFVTARLRQMGAAGASMESTPVPDVDGTRWQHQIRIPF